MVLPFNRLWPTDPSPPPLAPLGAWRRRSVNSVTVHGDVTRYRRTMPSPPRCEPPPPDAARSEYSSIRIGEARSSDSIGVLSVLLIPTCTPLGPAALDDAPWPRPRVS